MRTHPLGLKVRDHLIAWQRVSLYLKRDPSWLLQLKCTHPLVFFSEGKRSQLDTEYHCTLKERHHGSYNRWIPTPWGFILTVSHLIWTPRCSIYVQVNLDMTDSTGPAKLVRHMRNPSYTYDEYLICIGLGPSISSFICKNPSYSGPSYPS